MPSRSPTCGDAAYDGTCEDLFFYIERLIVACVRRGRRRPSSYGAQPQRHRHDDVPDAAAGVHRWPRWTRCWTCARRCSIWPSRHRETIFAAHTHTQPAQPTTVAHYLLAVIEQLERDAARLRAAYEIDQPQSARRVRDHRHRVSHRSHADERPARVRRADRQHVRQHRDGRLPARERRQPRSVLLVGLGRVVQDLLLWCTRGVRLSAPGGRLRAGQQHHAAEAQPGRARARARDREQGARAGAGDRDRASTTRRSATSSTPKTICSRSSRRCSATRTRAVALVAAAMRGAEFDVERLEARAGEGGTTLTELADTLVRDQDCRSARRMRSPRACRAVRLVRASLWNVGERMADRRRRRWHAPSPNRGSC